VTKPLILAIEPDRAQGAQLASIARRLGAELVLKESAPDAIELLEGPLPDLILIPALLSLRDDLALTARLRELGEAGDHIQTLNTPILETAEPASSGGMLAALRRDRPRAAGPTACDADTFAGQMEIYLERAVARRGSPALPGPEPPAPEPPAPEPPPALVTEAPPAQPDDTPVAPEAPPLSASDHDPEEADAVVMCDVSDWSCFDPAESRFVALLAKLDEITARES